MDLATDEIICYEPLAAHGEEDIDIDDIWLIGQFFKPKRASKRVCPTLTYPPLPLILFSLL